MLGPAVTCLEAEPEVEESSVPQGTQEVMAALKGRHQDGARDNFCREQEKRRLMSLTTQPGQRPLPPPGSPRRALPPPSISLCSSSNEGSFRMRAEMSVQSPMAHSGDMPLVSPKGVMSRQATSCSISVQLAGRRKEGSRVLSPETDGRG